MDRSFNALMHEIKEISKDIRNQTNKVECSGRFMTKAGVGTIDDEDDLSNTLKCLY